MNVALAISDSAGAPASSNTVDLSGPDRPALPVSQLIQPVADVPLYLVTRAPVLDCQAEPALLLTLPVLVRAETRALCCACFRVRESVCGGRAVHPACAQVLPLFPSWSWALITFRAKYDAWARAKDWLVLVNRAKAGKAWIEREFGLTNDFLDYAASRCGEFKRDDALPEAVRSLHRQWVTGANHRGEIEAIPGYEWATRNPARVPQGWTHGNLRKQLRARAKWLASHKALAHRGIAAARDFVPQVRSTRAGLRFLEEVQFDDVKVDFRIFNPATGRVEDLWLLIAHDRATARLLGYGMRPASVREDGTQEHLKLADMKQLCGWLLERYGLPPYVMTWKIEHGTATLSEGTVAALNELLGGRVVVSFSSMIGGRSPSGYLERALGNSKGKASLESHNRITHLILAGQPGQVGPRYDVRPADLAAREKECRAIFEVASQLPAEVSAKFGYPLLTLAAARAQLTRAFAIRNGRTDHALEGFEQVLVEVDGEIVQRLESPDERAAKLVRGVEFAPVSPEIVAAFYEHTQRRVVVQDNGEIEFVVDGRKLTFANPTGAAAVPGTKLLGYFHPDDARYLHLTTGKGAVVGTWIRRALVRSGDTAALGEAIAYQRRALAAAQERAAELNQGELDRLHAMRARNAELLHESEFIELDKPAEYGQRPEVFASPVARGLTGARRAAARQVEQVADDELRAREALED